MSQAECSSHRQTSFVLLPNWIAYFRPLRRAYWVRRNHLAVTFLDILVFHAGLPPLRGKCDTCLQFWGAAQLGGRQMEYLARVALLIAEFVGVLVAAEA